ncbi:MAG: hypothetical protein Q4C98_11350 [Capnocytophaga sp.]|nr:hypothetical protein [Capnocytophaga sp.]
MPTIQELREYKNSVDFQDFLKKFQQDKAFKTIFKKINAIFESETSLQADNSLTDKIKLSSVDFEKIKNEIKTNAESFFAYYKKFLFLYADEDLANEIDEEDDYEPDDFYDQDAENYPSIITSNSLLGCMIDFYLLRHHQDGLFDYHKKLKIPNSKKHSKALIDIYDTIVV